MAISRERRTANYQKQAGRRNPTPRQRRRLDKKQATMDRRSSARS